MDGRIKLGRCIQQKNCGQWFLKSFRHLHRMELSWCLQWSWLRLQERTSIAFTQTSPYDANVTVEGKLVRRSSTRKPFQLMQLHVAMQDTPAEMGGIEWVNGEKHEPLEKGMGVLFDGNSNRNTHRGLANTSNQTRRMLVAIWASKRHAKNPKVRMLLQHYYPGATFM